MFDRLVRPVAAAAFMTAAVCSIPAVVVAAAEGGPAERSQRHAVAVDVARRHVETHLADLGLESGDIAELTVSDVYTSRHTGITHVYLLQRYEGIAVHNGLINLNVLANGDVLHVGNRAVAGLMRHELAVAPRIDALQAVHEAAQASELVIDESITVLEQTTGASRRTVFSDAGIALEPIKAQLAYVTDARERLRLAWQVEIYEHSAKHYWLNFVDAESGKLIKRRDLVVHDRWPGPDDAYDVSEKTGSARTQQSASGPNAATASTDDGSEYRVFEIPKMHPDDGPRTLVTEPAHEPASPYGWHDTDGVDGAEYTITRGNNVHAYQDRNASDSSSGDEPDGGLALDFDFPLDLADDPVDYIEAAVTNLFYWNNLHHDLSHVRGFDEAAGNFQVANYGNGGAGNDAVRAEAQDGEGVNNANFFTPADGSPPRMQMFTWNQTSPERDGDLDAGIILHEYGHGISNRQTGGPSQTFCLGNAEQAGEGWSDWQTLIYTAKSTHTATTKRGVGTYALGQASDGDGIRAFPYSTDMKIDPRTYADTQSAAPPHGVGSIWTAMLWEVYWNLVDEYGFNPDFYADWDQGGNLLAMQLVNDGLKIQPCSPGFVDGRDAILAADQALTGGENQCRIWEGFAKRGLGFSAAQGSSDSNSDNTEAFDMPPACEFGQATPTEQAACVGDPVDFEIALGSAWTAPVDLSASGHPGSASFSTNPVSAPGSSTLTIDSTGGETSGVYGVNVEATDGSETEQFPLELELFEQVPDGTTLDAPADGAVDVSTRPSLSWTAASGATSYLVEIATDAAFTNIVHSATVAGLTHEPDSALSASTTHYWRVQALNPCGTAAMSQTFSFTTANVVEVCRSPDLSIPDGDPAGIDDVLTIAASENILDVNVHLRGTHAWVGDLAFRLTHPDGGTQAMVVDRPGVPDSQHGCDGDDFDLWVDDEGVDGPVEAQCASTAPALFGNPTPNDALSAFDGLAANGDWTLNASDHFGADPGMLAEWCLEITYEAPVSGPHTVTPSAGAGGSIAPSTPQSVAHNDSFSFSLTPDPGFGIDSVSGSCGGTLDGNTFMTDPITADCSVDASFAASSYTVTAATGGGQGSITPASQSVDHGDSAGFTVMPDAGWSVDSVTGDTCSPADTGGGTWTADSITADCAVTASFRINEYTVMPSAGSGGSISPSVPQTVDHGESLQFGVSPDWGYMIDSVDGTCSGSLVGEIYTTDPVTQDCTVDALFEALVDEVFDDRFETP